jgi:hypothetical protein
MNIDRGSFLILVSTLAIGAAGGYVVAEKRLFPALDKWRGRPPETPPAPPPPPPPPPMVVADAAPPAPPPPPPAAPACDDSVGTPGECPPPGYPTIEGGCGSFASTRCGELKQSMKPRVAAAAVACLNKLTPKERCDAARVSLCGHLAFMNACPEVEPTTRVTAICQGIIDGCGASPVAPSMTECRQLLSGMTEGGRERTRTCMKTHCFDRGLIGCEGVAVTK